MASREFQILIILTVSVSTVTLMDNNSVNNNRHLYYKGRHICVQKQEVQHRVNRVQTYCKPVYKQHMRVCGNGYSMCPSFQLVYQLAYRQVQHTVPKVETVYSCCPGWTQYSANENACMRPLCTEPCRNNGRCLQPDVCTCPKGFGGKTCEDDINECSTDVHGCDQKCKNMPGSYTCSCYDGFQLKSDGRTCKLSLESIPEYRELQNNYDMIKQKINEIEKEKASTAVNVTHIIQEYQRTMAFHAPPFPPTVQAPTTSKVTSSSGKNHPYHDEFPMDRLASLSDQIAILEERLADCTCTTLQQMLNDMNGLNEVTHTRRRRKLRRKL